MIKEENTYFILDGKPGISTVFTNKDDLEVAKSGEVPAGANVVELKDYQKALEDYEANVLTPSKDDYIAIEALEKTLSVKDEGLQAFANEALGMGFSTESIQALTGKEPKKGERERERERKRKRERKRERKRKRE